jgi:hypothetical protein
VFVFDGTKYSPAHLQLKASTHCINCILIPAPYIFQRTLELIFSNMDTTTTAAEFPVEKCCATSNELTFIIKANAKILEKGGESSSSINETGSHAL